MDLLKRKIHASTLLETLVATVLIVVTFMMASMVLNSLFEGTLSRNDQWARQELYQLRYRYHNGKLSLPYRDERGPWRFGADHQGWHGDDQIIFRATHRDGGRELVLGAEDMGHD